MVYYCRELRQNYYLLRHMYAPTWGMARVTIIKHLAMAYMHHSVKRAIKMSRLIVEVVGRVPVGEVRGDAWFGLFDEVGTVQLLNGLSGFVGATLFGESQSMCTWHQVRVVV